eukprot:Rhum_TRINITY_DN14559_c12_g3::Rhum_TRINITY_DN14559_c12_g3_i1::g.98627::m.98627
MRLTRRQRHPRHRHSVRRRPRPLGPLQQEGERLVQVRRRRRSASSAAGRLLDGDRVHPQPAHHTVRGPHPQREPLQAAQHRLRRRAQPVALARPRPEHAAADAQAKPGPQTLVGGRRRHRDVHHARLPDGAAQTRQLGRGPQRDAPGLTRHHALRVRVEEDEERDRRVDAGSVAAAAAAAAVPFATLPRKHSLDLQRLRGQHVTLRRGLPVDERHETAARSGDPHVLQLLPDTLRVAEPTAAPAAAASVHRREQPRRRAHDRALRRLLREVLRQAHGDPPAKRLVRQTRQRNLPLHGGAAAAASASAPPPVGQPQQVRGPRGPVAVPDVHRHGAPPHPLVERQHLQRHPDRRVRRHGHLPSHEHACVVVLEQPPAAGRRRRRQPLPRAERAPHRGRRHDGHLLVAAHGLPPSRRRLVAHLHRERVPDAEGVPHLQLDQRRTARLDADGHPPRHRRRQPRLQHRLLLLPVHAKPAHRLQTLLQLVVRRPPLRWRRQGRLLLRLAGARRGGGGCGDGGDAAARRGGRRRLHPVRHAAKETVLHVVRPRTPQRLALRLAQHLSVALGQGACVRHDAVQTRRVLLLLLLL